jgi:hypothetical protein
MMKLLKYGFMLAVLAAPITRADSVQEVASVLRADSPVPFHFGVADDLAANLLDAQSLAPYASQQSLDDSILAVVRAIGIDDTPFVGWSATDPITWLQSDIAIDPGASLGFSPTALNFGARDVVATPEPAVWLMLLVALIVMGSVAVLMGKVLRYRRKQQEPEPPRILTKYGPVTESARRQAAINMREDLDLRAKVYLVVLSECDGDDARALAEMRRRYPEAYLD